MRENDVMNGSFRQARLSASVAAIFSMLLLVASGSLAGVTDNRHVSYYIDGSGSMCGFLRGNDPARVFQKIVEAAMRSKDAKLDRHVFLLSAEGKRPRVVEAEEDLLKQVSQRSEPGSKRSCGTFKADTSSLDGVFLRYKSEPGTSMIVVTDLLLREHELTSFVDNVRDWAGAAGNEGAHAGFVTLSAPFDGPYYQTAGGQSFPGPHIRPLTVFWFAPSDAGRSEVGRLLKALGLRIGNDAEPVGAGAPLKRPGSLSPPASATSRRGEVGAAASAPKTPDQEVKSSSLLYGLQVLPYLTSNMALWLSPLPDRNSFQDWLDILPPRIVAGSGRNAKSLEGCVRGNWLNTSNVFRIVVNEQCNDKELFPYKQTRAHFFLTSKVESRLMLRGVQVVDSGAIRCVRKVGKDILPCREGEQQGTALELYRLPTLRAERKGSVIEPQKVELLFAAADPKESSYMDDASKLDLANDVCPTSFKVDRCKDMLDGKVYRYATFVSQVVGRTSQVVEQWIASWPRSLSVEVEVIRAK